MSESELEEFHILRQLPEPMSQAERERASERSIEALELVRDDGHAIDWVRSQIFESDEGDVVGTLCHFKADSESALHEHAECAGLPITQIYRRGQPVSGP